MVYRPPLSEVNELVIILSFTAKESTIRWTNATQCNTIQQEVNAWQRRKAVSKMKTVENINNDPNLKKGRGLGKKKKKEEEE